MMNNFNASPVYSHQQQQCQPQQQSRALVPATAPGRTVYSNYVVPTTTTTINNTNDDDLIDLGGGDNMSAGYGTTYSQQSTSYKTTNNAADDDDDLISFDNNMSFATPPPSTSASTVAASNTNAVEVRDLRTLQDRDDEFVKNLPKELIEEQKRILSQIQKRNNNRSNGNNQLVSWNSTGQERFEQKLMDSLPEEESSSSYGLPAEVHPKKYQMKTERKVKTAASATAGMVVGGLILAPVFPIGMAAGAAVGGYTAKVISRSGERKQQRKWDQKNFNDYTAQGNCDVQSDNVVFA